MSHGRKPRILISRLSHIGDCIATMPVLCALRSHFSKALIVWAVEAPTDQLLRGHEALDEVVVVRRGWMKSLAEIRRIRRQLRGLRIDVAIDPQSLTKSAMLARLSGAPRRIGFARGLGRELAPLLNNELVKASKTHIVERQLELLKPLGIRAPEVQFKVPLEVESHRTIQTFIKNSHLGCGFAVVNPGAGWRSRLWPIDRFGVVAQHLGRQHSLPTVVTWAGKEERAWAQQIFEHSGGHALVAPKTNLLELASLLRCARLFIGCDTGPMHLSVAVGTDSVVLHGTTRAEISGPYGHRHIAIQEYYQSGSSRERRRAENDAMRSINVEAVTAACNRIIQRQKDENALRFVA